MTRTTIVVAGMLIASTLVSAQAPESAGFEAASIKRNRSVENAIGGAGTPDTYRRTNASLLLVLAEAYEGRFYLSEIVGGPDWLKTDKFDIVAKTGGSHYTGAMMRALLAERFKLRVHEETRQQDVYRLVLDRPDRRLGPKLVVASNDPAAQQRCSYRIALGRFDGKCASIDYLIKSTLAAAVQRRVIDDTRLAGTFNIDLTWDPTFDASPEQRVPSDAPTIFTALREQLGLRLEPGKARVPVLVIDAVQYPSED